MIDSPPRQPGQDEPEALIPEARERQRRRWLIGATVVALSAALALAIDSITSGVATSPKGHRSPAPVAGAPPCRAMQLKTMRLAPGLPAVFNQVSLLGVGITVVTNPSHAACSIPAPEVSIFSHGRKLGVQQVDGLAFRIGPKAPPVHVLRPGKSAQVDLTWRNWCGSPTLHGTRELKTVRIRFGSALTVAGKVRKPACGLRGTPSTVSVAQLSWVLKKPYAAHHRVWSP